MSGRRAAIVSMVCGVLLSLVIGVGGAYAGTAIPEPIVVRQPDGASFSAVIRGDESINWVETATGYSIARSASGRWEYARRAPAGHLEASGVPVEAGKASPPGVAKHLRPADGSRRAPGLGHPISALRAEAVSSDAPAVAGYAGLAAAPWSPQPVSGQRKLVVVLVGFSNRAILTTPTEWGTAVFGTTAGAKTLANFYTDNSFGAVSVGPAATTQSASPAGIVKVTLSTAHPNPGGNISIASEQVWLNSALTAADPYVDQTALDANGDGTISPDEACFFFIVAGYESSGSGKGPGIWAHSVWGGSLHLGTKAISTWALNGELNDNIVRQPIGTTIHEFGHEAFALPDLYDPTGTTAGVGMFSTMGSGSWGRTLTEMYPGTTPSGLDAWSREYLGWSAPRVPGGSGLVSFPAALSQSNAPVRMVDPTLSTTEYFLVENRVPVGWDEGLAPWLTAYGLPWTGGLLIEHIDQNITTMNSYVAGSHQAVVVEQASTAGGSLMANTSRGEVRHLFYSGNNATFNDTSSPSSRLYSGVAGLLSLAQISLPGTLMTAQYGGGGFATNQAPVVDAGADATTAPGATLNRTVTFTDADSSAWSATVDWGDGSALYTTQLVSASFGVTHSYVSAGSYNVTVTVTDSGGAAGQDTFIVTVNAASGAPVVNLGAPATSKEGATLSRTCSFSDPGSTSWTITADWGDGSAVQAVTRSGTSFSLRHLYKQEGAYTITVRVTNKAGRVGVGMLAVTVTNVTPVVNAGINVSRTLGTLFSRSGSFADSGADTWTATVDYGDGGGAVALTLSGKRFALSHLYTARGAYTVTVTVSDNSGATGTDTAVVTIN